MRQTLVYSMAQKMGSNEKSANGYMSPLSAYKFHDSMIAPVTMQLPPIPKLHDDFTTRWHTDAEAKQGSGLEALIIEQHRQNFALWHEEDRARAPLASPDEIAQTKRNIDALNQVRNDLVEAIDRELLQQLETRGVKLSGELHSETPGMIVDRLSILSLKLFHTREQVDRSDVASDHVERNRERLKVLIEQRQDLADCLKTLWRDVQNGKRHFKLYRQLKMYNDPELNPEIYRARS
jgi:hypothetical protein